MEQSDSKQQCTRRQFVIGTGALSGASILSPQLIQKTQMIAAANPESSSDRQAASGDFLVKPYLQFVTQDSIIIKWKTPTACQGQVLYGETTTFDKKQSDAKPCTLHEIKLSGLTAQTQYFYQVRLQTDTGSVNSEIRTFQTASHQNSPFSFVVIGDTQNNLPVASKIAGHAWGQRPNFCLHVGDLVGAGKHNPDWLNDFFPSMDELISRVTFFPVLGNHEQNAKNYYDYMTLPAPEYYYEFSYGNAQFFMMDSNKDLSPGSEQYQWLKRKLSESRATWKFVCHHHPPYSSDENDYGNLWTGKSTYGDSNARHLAQLHDQYHVDIDWSGHIHSYERTWPIHNKTVVNHPAQHGTIYMVTGGGGGPLETPGPTHSPFQNVVKYGHHYCIVSINGPTLEFKAFDLENRLFDSMTLVKKDQPS